MPSESDAASETVAEAEIDTSRRCARSSVDVEELIDAMLRKGRGVKLSPDGTITFYYKMRRKACKPSDGGSVASRGEGHGDTASPARNKTAKKIRDEQRNTRERYEARVLKRIEKAKAERHEIVATGDITTGRAEEQASPVAETADVAMGQTTPERRGVRDVGAREGKRRAVTCETAEAIERKAATMEVVAAAAASRDVTKQKKAQARVTEVMHKSKGITRPTSESQTTSYASAAYKALTRGERMLAAAQGRQKCATHSGRRRM